MTRLLTALDGVVDCVAVGLARTGPIALLVPAFGGRHLPTPLRIGLGLALSVLVMPVLAPGVAAFAATAGPVGWSLLIAREVLIGATLGLVVAFAFRAAEMAGHLSDLLRGANLAEVISPSADERSSALAGAYGLLTVVLFFEIGGARAVAAALARSYRAIPVGAGVHASSLRDAAWVVVHASARVFEAGLALAAPVVVTLLLVDCLLGFLARLTPHVPFYFVAMPLKALLGVGLVLLSLAALDAALTGELRAFLGLLGRMISAWR